MDTPSVRERRLAHELRLLRTAAQLHGKDVAASLGWSPSKVSRIENGRSGIGEDDLERLVELYRVPEQQAGYLRRLAPSARPRGWWDAYAETLSAGYANLIRLEAGSQALRCYGALVPHALLQTPDYAREVITSSWEPPSPGEVERRGEGGRRRPGVVDPRRGRRGPRRQGRARHGRGRRRPAAAYRRRRVGAAPQRRPGRPRAGHRRPARSAGA